MWSPHSVDEQMRICTQEQLINKDNTLYNAMYKGICNTKRDRIAADNRLDTNIASSRPRWFVCVDVLLFTARSLP